MTAQLDLAEAIEAVRQRLADEGADAVDGWHSWRCFDKVRYPGKCHCTQDVAEGVIEAALPFIREQLAQRCEANAADTDGGYVDGCYASARIIRGEASC